MGLMAFLCRKKDAKNKEMGRQCQLYNTYSNFISAHMRNILHLVKLQYNSTKTTKQRQITLIGNLNLSDRFVIFTDTRLHKEKLCSSLNMHKLIKVMCSVPMVKAILQL